MLSTIRSLQPRAHLRTHRACSLPRSPAAAGPARANRCSSSPRRQHPWAACRAQETTGDASSDSCEVLNRITRIQRQLDVAVSEEDYALAARLRDESKVVFDSLPPVQQFMYQQLKVLHAGSLEDKLRAISGLAATGDSAALPHLAGLLTDKKLQDDAQAAMWTIFMTCKDPVAQDALNEGTRLMGSPSTYQRAMMALDQVIKRCPDFAEGYNKRATLLYVQRQFRESIEDCRTVLSMQPYHFGAASGMGLCHLQLGEYDDAVKAFDIALNIHPNMPDISKIAANLKDTLQQEAAQLAQQQQEQQGKQAQ